MGVSGPSLLTESTDSMVIAPSLGRGWNMLLGVEDIPPFRMKPCLWCNLDYRVLIHPEPRLSGLAGDQKIHYYECADGIANGVVTGGAMS